MTQINGIQFDVKDFTRWAAEKKVAFGVGNTQAAWNAAIDALTATQLQNLTREFFKRCFRNGKPFGEAAK